MFRPFDRDTRIVGGPTLRFAKVLSHRYAESSSPRSRWTRRRTTADPSPAV